MKSKALIFCLALLFTIEATAQQSTTFLKSGIAIQGYDPVAYFTEAKPVKGTKKFSFKWNNAPWLFSSQQNLDSFRLNPEKFAPQYGGYCAYGMSEGHKAPTEPGAWTIVDGKLYLNYNFKVKEMWIKDPGKRIDDANKNWPLVKDKQ